MDVFVTFAESFIAGSLPMEWQTTEVHVEEMEWEWSDLDEPMDWEDIPEVRCAKKSKVSKRINNVTFQPTSTPAAPMEVSKPVIPNTSVQVKKTTPAKKKVSPPVDNKENSSLQVTPNPPDPIKVSALAYYESMRRKIRSKPKVSPPQQLIGRKDEGGGFFNITGHVTQQKWQRWSTPSHQRTVEAPPVAERRSSSNWEMKILFVTERKGRRTHFLEACERRGCRKTTPGAVQKGNFRRVKKKDSPRGTTGSRPPSGVPRATLRSHAGEQWLTGYFEIRSVLLAQKTNCLQYSHM
ncbi:hypothetical protein NPIL_112701 [Nephila pilipes]|uniref:Uncharacterized protein n=1 Tax=Nephila pilipes TaxID=299642 RepID=A0A8X6PIY4_NEPPI|nr:hypothetical protein NPIL_112701 [Nephila pilipes]